MALTPDEIRQRVRTSLQEQRELVTDLLRRREQLAGSLFVRFGICGKHIPAPGLRIGGKGGFAYLAAARLSQARELVKAYREYRAGMRRLRRVNEQLVGLLRRYQEATTKRGSRRVGVNLPVGA